MEQIKYEFNDELVSSDIVGSTAPAIYDSKATIVSPNKKNIILYSRMTPPSSHTAPSTKPSEQSFMCAGRCQRRMTTFETLNLDKFPRCIRQSEDS